MTVLTSQENSTGTICLDKPSEAPIYIDCDKLDGNLNIKVSSGINAEIHAELKKTESLNININLEDSSGLSFRFTTDRSSKAHISQKVCIGKSSAFQCRIFTKGNCDHEIVSEVNGKNSVSNVEWVFHAVDDQKQRIGVRNVFNAPSGSSEVVLKGVAEDFAEVVCKGFIGVGVECRMSNVALAEEVLILDDGAKVDLIPAMEIKNDDVKASHSASVRNINPEDLFYFSSRGIGQEEARGIIREGFLDSCLI
ncbi:SufD family Fe-S cluster assembly protein [Patescibacteria group bacterium]|nr:SufD family Fe-S cluster assembly protein [Patescibacteria group bacterium]MBU1123598.1 SufD family Fe-S cluster assembly protein [Patescibacteria group bacterium]